MMPTTDGTKNVTLSYNYLNLTNTVAGTGLSQTYTYDSQGTKHQMAHGSAVTKYAGVFEYDANNVVKRVAITDGQAIVNGNYIAFQYYHKDHLGNVRNVIDEDGNIQQRTDYYPFGLEITRQGGGNKYLYNGKEKQSGTGYLATGFFS